MQSTRRKKMLAGTFLRQNKFQIVKTGGNLCNTAIKKRTAAFASLVFFMRIVNFKNLLSAI